MMVTFVSQCEKKALKRTRQAIEEFTNCVIHFERFLDGKSMIAMTSLRPSSRKSRPRGINADASGLRREFRDRIRRMAKLYEK